MDGSPRDPENRFRVRSPADVNQWCCVSTRLFSTSVRASAMSPLIAQPTCRSISRIFSMDDDSTCRRARARDYVGASWVMLEGAL